MIFVTVGTHEQPFNRLIQKVDELKHDGSRKYSPMHYMKKLATVLKMEKYDVIHVNGNSSTMAMELVSWSAYHQELRMFTQREANTLMQMLCFIRFLLRHIPQH